MCVHITCDKMNRMKEVKKVSTHVLLDPYLDAMLTREAKLEERTRTDIIEEALKMYFEKKLEKQSKKVVV